MRNSVMLICLFSLVLNGCSKDSPAPLGHGVISMKIDGVVYSYTNISTGYENTSDINGNPASLLYIRAEDDANTYEHREAFVFRPYRGGVYNHQILIAARLIDEGASTSYSWSGNQQDMNCIFTQNDEKGFKGTFDGYLHDGNETLHITEGTIEIVYGKNNYGPSYDPNNPYGKSTLKELTTLSHK